MLKLLYSQSTQSIKPCPRLDDQPIAGLDPDYLVLEKVEVAPISYDPATQSLSSTYVVDTDSLKYRQEWTVTDLPYNVGLKALSFTDEMKSRPV